jgi:hypothetical protein
VRILGLTPCRSARLQSAHASASRGDLSDLAGADHPDHLTSPMSQPPEVGEIFTRSAAAATLSAGLVIRVAISRARAMYCGARIRRRSATSGFWVLVEKPCLEPTFSRLTLAPESV